MLYPFKSYYVVWKPLSEPAFSVHISLFKSYYVVWKHNLVYTLVEKPNGLNRTM